MKNYIFFFVLIAFVAITHISNSKDVVDEKTTTIEATSENTNSTSKTQEATTTENFTSQCKQILNMPYLVENSDLVRKAANSSISYIQYPGILQYRSYGEIIGCTGMSGIIIPKLILTKIGCSFHELISVCLIAK